MSSKNNLYNSYKLWLENASGDPDLIEELKGIAGDGEAISDRFYKSLSFGTAGIRGVIGAGTNRMNIYTVGVTAQGLADYLNDKFESPSVAIAYDSRIKSGLFARESAGILAANGIRVSFFPEIAPVPLLSFAVRRLGCSAGIMITASHNPARYNGFKCYGPEGYQLTDEAAGFVFDRIQKTDFFAGIRKTDFDEAVNSGMVSMIPGSLTEEYLDRVEAVSINPGIVKMAGLSVIYTPLNGAGNKLVREILRRAGAEDVAVVPEQELPDGSFPTCLYPNPEMRQTFDMALKMAEAMPADLLLATDPDADRVGIAVRGKSGYTLMTGNEVGVLMLNYILSGRHKNGTLPKDPVAVRSIVSTGMFDEAARRYGCGVKKLLTGFKYIGEFITELEKRGEESRFIMAFEESYGYLAGTHARDKDAVVASMLICEMAAFYKIKGKTLSEALEDLKREYGYYTDTVKNFAFDGEDGTARIDGIMARLHGAPPRSLAGMRVVKIRDYKKGTAVDLTTGGSEETDLPRSDMIALELSGGCGVIIRPSGTEPKIKIYISAVAKTGEEAEKLDEALAEAAGELMA